MHPSAVKEAEIYDVDIDLPMWFSSLSLDEKMTEYHDQKRQEALTIMKLKNKPAEKPVVNEKPNKPDKQKQTKLLFKVEKQNWLYYHLYRKWIKI